jgi:hypothetical protein
LIKTTVEAAGANCATGGFKVEAGLDQNADGTLQTPEIDLAATRFVCNGAQGPQGAPGGIGPTGPAGATGAQGATGLSSLFKTSAEPAGGNCATGGVKVEAGIDQNGNATLDTAEINATLTRFVCNGAQGPQGIQGATGSTGPAGATGATGPQGPAGSLGVYGDGSAGSLLVSGTLDLSSPTALLVLPGLNLQFTDLTVTGSLIVPSGTVLRATGNVTVTGTITVLPGTGDSGGFRPLAGVALAPAGQPQNGVGVSVGQAAQVLRVPFSAGGAGARSALLTGGEGGGSVAIHARGNISVGAGGFIRANGANSVNPNTASAGLVGGGGGAGGVVVLLAKGTMTVSGTIQATGGNGSSGFDGNGGNSEGGGGGGGGGIVHLLASSAPSVSGSIQVNGGAAGANAGASATITGGGGGGACGGNGGVGGITGGAPANGAVGHVIQTATPSPENLLF